MKVVSNSGPKKFEPVSITITFESEDELKTFIGRLKPMENSQRIKLGLDKISRRQGNNVFQPILERLDKLINGV